MEKVRLATQEDLEFIYKLCTTNSKNLRIMWRGMIKDDIDKGKIYIIDNIGFCRFNVMKRKPVVKLETLVVHKNYRGQGYGRLLVDKLKEFNRPIILECVKGADNNAFYNKVGRCYGERQLGKANLLKYVINENEDFNENL